MGHCLIFSALHRRKLAKSRVEYSATLVLEKARVELVSLIKKSKTSVRFKKSVLEIFSGKGDIKYYIKI